MDLFQSISNMLLSSRSCRIVQHKAGCQHRALLQLSRQKFNINKNNWKWKLGGEGGKGARQTNSQMPRLRKKILKITDIPSKKEVYPLFNALCGEAPWNGLVQALLEIESREKTEDSVAAQISHFTGLETDHTVSEGRSSTISVAESEALWKTGAELIACFLTIH